MPGQVRLAAVGDTVRLRAGLYDGFGISVPGAQITWTSADPGVFTIDQGGLVTGTQALGIGRAIASSGDRADTAYVVVANPDASPCLGYSAPVTLAVGQTASVSLADGACIASAAAGEEYLLVPWQGSTLGFSNVVLEVTGSGLASVEPSASLAPSASALAPSASEKSMTGGRSRSLDLERRIRETGRGTLMPLARQARPEMARRAAAAARGAMVPAYLALGDLVGLNVNSTSPCTAPNIRTGRVAAISSRAIVVADTANPTGGFTDADYRRFAVTFDTLVAPVADATFGAPTDIDVNGKVVIFFTRAVNELTPTDAPYFYGGYFHPRDLVPRELNGSPYCPGSNEREMFYMLVPDPTGVVNSNEFSFGFVDSLTVGVLAHEHQHLVNFARRAYVNGAVYDEEVWLNEGLSHIAEELVFYRAAAAAPRQNIGGGSFGTQPFDALFNLYMAPNFDRLQTYLQTPHNFSPYSSYDDLGTRGAVWAFLRYAADRRGSADGDVWMRLVNSTAFGFDNLEDVFGPDVLEMMHQWTLSVYTDDHVAGVDATHAQPSWNFRTAYPALPTAPRSYPLLDAVRALSNEVTQGVILRGGSGAFFRFAVPAGREAVVRVTSGGVMAPRTVRATVIRTR